jgi:hypothetical protein
LVSCSYDSDCKAGYIRVEAGRVLNAAEHFAMQVRHGRTLSLAHTYLVNVDVDNFERVTGVELLNAQELAVKLSMPVD